MTSAEQTTASVVSIWRYPVKSMMGEELNASEVTAGGLLGDRSYALVDSSDGKIASAKNPRKWPAMFQFRAALDDTPRSGVRITLPDGVAVHSTQADASQVLSAALDRKVALLGRSDLSAASAEEYSPDKDTVTDFAMPEGTFFDAAVVHLLTTSTLDRLRELYPQGRFEARRFRPNIVVETAGGEPGFVENGWVGQTLAIGNEVRLAITASCVRCVMTTLAQGDLPKDPGILRTAAQHNNASVGVYASVLRGGRIRRGDRVTLVRA